MDKKHTLILLSGGVGSRTKLNIPKQYVEINGVEMLLYSLVAVKNIDSIDEIIINYPENGRLHLEDILKTSGIKYPIKLVEAGETRQDSVNKMVQLAANDNVLIHEAARPVVFEQTFQKLIDCDYENVSYMCTIPFTVAPVDPAENKVTGSLKRELLRNVQLPQKFSKAALLNAHKWASENNLVYTEDACLVADSGEDAHFIEGDQRNIKVTERLDITTAEMLLRSIFKGGDDE